LERNRKIITAVLLLSIVSLIPGIAVKLYSQTYIITGIGAINWWWDSTYSYPGEEATLTVNNTNPQASLIISGGQLHIPLFNITGGNVTILVGCAINNTIARYDFVTGELFVYLVYPTEDPTNSLGQYYNITVILEDSAATVTFEYLFYNAQHADGSVTYIRQGYEEISDLGSNLLLGGLIIAGVILVSGVFLYLICLKQSNKT